MTGLIDPDCRDGKHRTCVGGPCECACHEQREHEMVSKTMAPTCACGLVGADDECQYPCGAFTAPQQLTIF